MSTERITTEDGRDVEDLVKEVQSHHPDCDGEMIRFAYEYANEAHGTQLRKSGVPYIVHPLSAAMTLADLGLDEKSVIAGLLHDVPEDTEKTLKDVQKEFGKEVRFLVEGITKLGQLKYRGVDRYVENLRRMFVAMAKDVRVVLIKFADRIHNLSTLEALPPEKRRRIALESLEIYAPIANRLGMGQIKGKIEDLSFKYVYPEEYQWMQKEIVPKIDVKEQMVDRLMEYIKDEFQKRGIVISSIHGREKHLYSLYQKLIKQDRDLSKIYDLIALRIIVDDVAKCYEALGVIHQICKPLKGRIKDYIAQPKPNGYQSLHTTVFAPQEFADDEDEVHGVIVEFQIRTPQMHAEAEFGIAAHWKYKDNHMSKEKMKQHMEWMEEMANLQTTITDDAQLLETIKLDFLQNYIFAFTPRGDVIELPEGATPVDFAYKIHTKIGNTCNGSKINDQMASLDTELKSGDVVEIIVNPHRKGPSPDWLDFVRTNTAKHHIRAHVNRKNRKLLSIKK